MEVTLQYFDSCPNWRVAEERLRQAVERVGARHVSLCYERVETAEQAARIGFLGSPTILIDGRDPFDGATEPVAALSCRVYRTDAGQQNAPTVEQLITALRG